jgi:hypothetical protein
VVSADAVGLVDHEVVGVEIREGSDGLAPLERRAAKPAPPRAEDVFLGDNNETQRRQLEPGGAIASDDSEPLATPEGRSRPWLEVVLGQDAPEPDGLLLIVHDEATAKPRPSPNLAGQL